jgi:NTP pyrophosphatase (non-canonical NTP hydrolase)
MTLNELRDEIAKINEEKGWTTTGRSFGDQMALIHTEVSEAFEDYRDGRPPNETRFTYNMNDIPADLQWYGSHTMKVGSEEEKQYEQWWNDMKAEGYLKPEGIPSELADIIVRVLDTAGEYGIDMDEAMSLKLRHNRTRPHRHGGKVV